MKVLKEQRPWAGASGRDPLEKERAFAFPAPRISRRLISMSANAGIDRGCPKVPSHSLFDATNHPP